jgi:hypothetical protein|tara:strand:- start:70 stop:642 length:573 start_codon:yes stop_codon:yes gene_type:complete
VKKIILYLSVCLITLTDIHSQSTENLTDDQKKEYNRRKLTVEKVSESSGNMGWYWGFFAKRVDTWRAFKGLANQIEAEEFFRIAGYTEEANKVKKTIEDANGKIGGGWLLYFVGLIGSVIPKTETVEYNFFPDETYVTFPYMIPGTIVWCGGLWLVYDGMLKKLQPVAPYESAADIAEVYNKNLLAEIIK